MSTIPLRGTRIKYYAMFDAYTADNAITAARIDALKAAGGNTFIFQGRLDLVLGGSVTLNAALARTRFIMSYLYSNSMYGMIYGANTYNQWASLTTGANTTMSGYFAAQAALASLWPNCIAYAAVDEAWASGNTDGNSALTDATIVTYSAEHHAAMRAVVPPNFPVAAMSSPANQGGGTSTFSYTGAYKTRTDQAAPYCDFLAYHVFDNRSLADSAAARAAYAATKDFVMPSTVAQLEGAGKVTLTGQLMSLANNVEFRGIGAFSLMDFDANTYGFFGSGYPTTARAAVTPFTAGVSGTYPTANVTPLPRNRRLSQVRQFQ